MKKYVTSVFAALLVVATVTPTFANITWPPQLIPVPAATDRFDLQTRVHDPIPPLFTVEDIFTTPETLGFSINAAGDALYFTAPVDGILNIFRRDIATGEDHQLTFETEQQMAGFLVVGGTPIFGMDAFGNENFHIFRIEADGSSTNLTPYPDAMFLPINLLEDMGMDDDILLMSNLSDPAAFGMYRLNVVTGELTRVLDMVAESAVLDHTGVIRIIYQQDGINYHVLYRSHADDDFAIAGTGGTTDVITILGFDENNHYVWALSNMGRETVALVLMNPANLEEIRVVFEHPQYDVAGTFGNMFISGQPGGVIYHDDFLNRVFLIEEAENFFTQLYTLVPQGSIVGITGISDDHQMVTVSVSSSTNRGQVFLWNRVADTFTLLSDLNFAPATEMATMVPFHFEARDGLNIPGYLTVPVGVAPVDLPVVVIPHGGPWVRDFYGGFFDWVQFLANRGYAVFQPNFRGSTGYGRAFFEASFGQWGLTMQDDITDGVLALIAQGIADPDRIAIMGASYGGYAALAGATFTPDLYAAAISLVGVSNIFTFLETIPPHWEREMWYHRVGHPVYDYDRLRATSPVFHVANITAPLFIAHGANDIRVTLPETTQMIEAMQALGIQVNYMIFEDEGHGLVFEHNTIAFFTAVEAFLAEHLGGRRG